MNKMRKEKVFFLPVLLMVFLSLCGCRSRSTETVQNTSAPSLSVREQMPPVLSPAVTATAPPSPLSPAVSPVDLPAMSEQGMKLSASFNNKKLLDYFLSGNFKAASADFLMQIKQNPKDPVPYYHLGTMYLDSGSGKEAVRYLEKAMRLKPEDVKVAGALATAYKNVGRTNDALIVVAHIVKKQKEIEKAAQIILYAPTFVDSTKIFYDRGLVSLYKEQYSKAFFEFKLACEFIDLAQCSYYMGRIQSLRRQYRKAETTFSEGIRKDPTNPDFYIELGKVYFRSRMYDKAQENFSKALQQDPNAREAYFGRGNTYYRLQKPDEAKEDFKSGLAIDPSLAPYHFNWGWAYLKAGSYDKAIDEFIKTVTSNMNHMQAHLYLAIAIINKVLHEQANPKPQGVSFGVEETPPEELLKVASTELKRALQLYPFHPKAHFYLGLYHLMQKKASEEDVRSAFLELKQAVDLDPGNALYHHLLGIAYSRFGAVEEAIREIRKCVRLSPRDADAYFSLGVIFVNLDKLELARSAFLKVIALDPDNQDGHFSLASTYFAMGQRDAALREIKKAVGLDPEYLNTLFAQGAEFYKKGMLNQAIDVYKSMTGYDPKAARPHYLLGLLYYVKGFYPQSLREFNTALKLDPSQKVASVAAYIVKELRRKKTS